MAKKSTKPAPNTTVTVECLRRVKHDGDLYRSGEIVDAMDANQAARLVALGAVKIIPAAPPAASTPPAPATASVADPQA